MVNLFNEMGQLIAKGGVVMVPLLALGVVLFTTIFRLWSGMRATNRRTHPAGTAAGAMSVAEMTARRVEWTLHLNRRLRFIQVLAGTAPLLGLLGTVAGMLKTFRGLSIRAATDTMDMVAVGISEALITTETGLTFGILATLLVFLLREYRATLTARFERHENEIILGRLADAPPC